MIARRSVSILESYVAPGPGSYRTPSDFGVYDSIKDWQ